MDELLKKMLDGEISEDDFLKEYNAKTPEEQEKIREQAQNQIPEELQTLKGIRLEKKRNEELVEKYKKDADELKPRAQAEDNQPAPQDQSKTPDFGTTFRNEQISKAASSFFKEFQIPEAEQSWYLEEFKKPGNDSGKIDAEFILLDFKKLYVNRDPDSFIQSKQRLAEMEKDAVDFNTEQAGGHGGGSGGGDGKQYPKGAYDLVAAAKRESKKLTLDEATRYLKKGGERTLS